MKKESKLLKFIDLWSLGKVVVSGAVLWYYVVYLYFKNTTYYDSFLKLVQDYLEGEVVLVMSLEEYIKLEEKMKLSEESTEDSPDTLE